MPFLQKILAFCWHLWASPVWSPWPWMHCLPQSVMSQLHALRPVQLSSIQNSCNDQEQEAVPVTTANLCFSAQCVVLFSTVCCAFQHSALCFSARCVVLFSTVRCAFQHGALCFSAQCVVLFSTMCCAFQHSALCFSAQCVVPFSTMPSSSPFQSPSPWNCWLPQSVEMLFLFPKKSGQKWSQYISVVWLHRLSQTWLTEC